VFKKIDCVMIRVADPEAAAAYYAETFGLLRLWQDGPMVGLGFPETDTEIVLHADPGIPHRVEVHYLVDDVAAAVPQLEARGCRTRVAPFDVAIGQCAVIEDPFGTTLCLLDMTKGPRPAAG